MSIEEIIRKVLEEMNRLENTGIRKNRMLVLGEEGALGEDVKRKCQEEYDLEFSGCFNDTDGFDAVLLLEISSDTLRKLALGMNPRLGPVMEMLMKGKKVFYLPEGILHRCHEKTCPRALYLIYEESLDKIHDFGILPLDTGMKKPDESMNINKEKRALIGEKEILKLMAKGEKILYLEGKALMTPLARDLIRDHGIQVKFTEGRQ